MVIQFQQTEEAKTKGITPPTKAHDTDSGFDMYSPELIILEPFERRTIDLQVRFALPEDKPLFEMLSMAWEAQIRPKSGRSKAGLDVEIGTIDNAYRGWTGVTITNTTGRPFTINVNEKLCQIVFAPVFLNVQLKESEVDTNTDRGEKGFGGTGLK